MQIALMTLVGELACLVRRSVVVAAASAFERPVAGAVGQVEVELRTASESAVDRS